MNPRPVLEEFDAFLLARRLEFRAVVIGGAALNLLGVISRQTKDCDVVDPVIPVPILAAAAEFATLLRQKGEVLADDWLNNGPRSLLDVLPAGWQLRVQPLFMGRALVLDVLGREDLLKSKVFALCDRGTDIQDCVALAPSSVDLQALLPWLELQDANPDWPTHVRATVDDLARRLGHGL